MEFFVVDSGTIRGNYLPARRCCDIIIRENIKSNVFIPVSKIIQLAGMRKN